MGKARSLPTKDLHPEREDYCVGFKKSLLKFRTFFFKNKFIFSSQSFRLYAQLNLRAGNIFIKIYKYTTKNIQQIKRDARRKLNLRKFVCKLFIGDLRTLCW